jgi:hypothetical protein
MIEVTSAKEGGRAEVAGSTAMTLSAQAVASAGSPAGTLQEYRALPVDKAAPVVRPAAC